MSVVIRLILLLALAISAAACSRGEKPSAGGAVTSASDKPARAEPPARAKVEVDPSIRPVDPSRPLRVGVTLHPYYSWVANIVVDTGVEVRPILPGEIDAGSYQPRPEDIRKLADLDAVVINGVGHDDFITSMIEASGNRSIVVIRPNQGTPLLRAARGGADNSHTFLSFTNAIQQTYVIERTLAALRPDLAPRFARAASGYAGRLRQIRGDAVNRLSRARIKRVVTVHDGYGYLCQELGITVAGVIEPAHGLVPSAAELGEMIDLVKREKIRVVLSEEAFPEKLLGALRDATGVQVHVIGHIASGPYTADKFEREMARNVETLAKALAH